MEAFALKATPLEFGSIFNAFVIVYTVAAFTASKVSARAPVGGA